MGSGHSVLCEGQHCSFSDRGGWAEISQNNRTETRSRGSPCRLQVRGLWAPLPGARVPLGGRAAGRTSSDTPSGCQGPGWGGSGTPLKRAGSLSRNRGVVSVEGLLGFEMPLGVPSGLCPGPQQLHGERAPECHGSRRWLGGGGGAGSGSAVSRVRPLPSCAVVSRLHVGAVTVPALPVATGLSEKMQWSSGNSGLQTAVMTAGDGAGGALARWQWHS